MSKNYLNHNVDDGVYRLSVVIEAQLKRLYKEGYFNSYQFKDDPPDKKETDSLQESA